LLTPTAHLPYRSAEFNQKFWLREDTGETTWRDPTAGVSMPHTVLECQVSKLINSDTCPRLTTGDAALPEPTFTEKFSEEHGIPYWVSNGAPQSGGSRGF
jgi:hypothetical protein